MPDLAILHLNLHREFFVAIAAKTKRVEYRSRTPYWKQRLENRDYKFIQFRNGYATLAPEMLVEFRGIKIIRKWGKPHYAIALGRIMKIKRWKG
jgi:hypothetical protein